MDDEVFAMILQAKDEASATMAEVSASVQRMARNIEQANLIAGQSFAELNAQTLMMQEGVTKSGAVVAAGLGATATAATTHAATIGESLSKAASNVSQSFQSVESDLSALRGTLLNAAMLTAPLAIAGGESLKFASDYEQSMLKIQGLTQATQDDIALWTPALIEMSKTGTKSAKELADAMFFPSSSGLHGTEALFVLEQAKEAATAGLGRMDVIANALGGTLNAYVAAADRAAKAPQYMDQITAAVVMGHMNPETLAPALSRVTPIAAAAGVPAADVLAALATETHIGGTVDQGATGLRAILTTLMAPKEQSSKVLDELGLGGAESGRRLREEGLQQYLAEIDRQSLAVAGGDKDRQDAILAHLFPQAKTALPVMLALTRTGGDIESGGGDANFFKKIDDFINNESGGITHKASETALTGFNAQMAILKNNVDAVGIAFGTALLPGMKTFVQDLLPALVSGLTQFANDAIKAGQAIGFLGSAFGTMAQAVGISLDPLHVIEGLLVAMAAFAIASVSAAVIGLGVDIVALVFSLGGLGLAALSAIGGMVGVGATAAAATPEVAALGATAEATKVSLIGVAAGLGVLSAAGAIGASAVAIKQSVDQGQWYQKALETMPKDQQDVINAEIDQRLRDFGGVDMDINTARANALREILNARGIDPNTLVPAAPAAKTGIPFLDNLTTAWEEAQKKIKAAQDAMSGPNAIGTEDYKAKVDKIKADLEAKQAAIAAGQTPPAFEPGGAGAKPDSEKTALEKQLLDLKRQQLELEGQTSGAAETKSVLERDVLGLKRASLDVEARMMEPQQRLRDLQLQMADAAREQNKLENDRRLLLDDSATFEQNAGLKRIDNKIKQDQEQLAFTRSPAEAGALNAEIERLKVQAHGIKVGMFGADDKKLEDQITADRDALHVKINQNAIQQNIAAVNQSLKADEAKKRALDDAIKLDQHQISVTELDAQLDSNSLESQKKALEAKVKRIEHQQAVDKLNAELNPPQPTVPITPRGTTTTSNQPDSDLNRHLGGTGTPPGPDSDLTRHLGGGPTITITINNPVMTSEQSVADVIAQANAVARAGLESAIAQGMPLPVPAGGGPF